MKKYFLLGIIFATLSTFSAPIKSLCAASATEVSGGAKPPPYDAEVEYIDSIVPAFIDTGIKPSPSCIVEIDGLWLSAGANSLGAIMGTYGDTYTFRYRNTSFAQLSVARLGTAPGGGTWISFTNSIKERHLYTYGANGVFLDGTVIADESTGTTVFGNWGHTFKIAGYNDTNSMRGGNCRYWSVRIWENGVLVRDFQPVRFTNENGEIEGAMFDKVSGTLFKNTNVGKGTFSVGLDK